MQLRKFSTSSYAVIEFQNDNSIGVVLSSWITSRNGKFFCKYPGVVIARKLINDKSGPTDDWKEFEVSVLRYKDTLLQADRSCEKLLSKSGSSDSEFAQDSQVVKRVKNFFPRSKPDSEEGQIDFNSLVPQGKYCTKTIDCPPLELVPGPSSLATTIRTIDLGSVQSTSIESIATTTLSSTPVTSFRNPNRSTPQQNKNFEELVLYQLQAIRNEIADLKLHVTSSKAADTQTLPDLPVNTVDQLKDLNEWLKTEENYKSLLKHFSVIGGHDWKSMTRRMLERSVGGPIQGLINLKGVKKVAFSGQLLCQCITRAVQIVYKKTTELEIEEVISKWFIGFADRNGGRERRRKNVTQDEAEKD